MKVRYYLLALSFLGFMLLNTSCKTSSKAREAQTSKETKSKGSILDNITKSSDLSGLVKKMTGSFISEGEIATDSSVYNVLLHTTPIWTTQPSKYLYVEQAIEGQEDQPLKQQVYELKKDENGGFEISRYNLSNSDIHLGQWKTPNHFDLYDTSILSEEEGCTLYIIQHADGSYSGSTRMDHCINSKEGAAYATTILKVRKDLIMSWEQGFNSDKVQVWGAEKGGYQFKRRSN